MPVKAAELQVVVGADTKAAEASLKGFSDKLGGIASGIGKVAAVGVAAGVTGLGAAFVGATKAAAGFEESISGIKAVSGATASEMEQISKLALQLGADTAFSAKEAAVGIEELVKGGLSIEDVMGGGAKAALDLAAAGSIGVAEAAEIASNAVGQFGLKGAKLGHAADLIAGAANASSLSVTDFKFSLAAVGAVANTIGLSFDDTAVAIAEMGKAGIKGSDAGTSLKTMLLNLQPSTNKATDEFRRLGLITEDGSNQFFDATGKAKGLAEIQGVLQKALAGMTKQQQLASLELIFGSDAIRAGAVLAKQGAEGFLEMADAMGKVTAADVARERLNNLNGSIKTLLGSLETAAIEVGLAFTPVLKELADNATLAVNAAIPELKRLAGVAVESGKTFLQALKGDWRPDGVDENGKVIWMDPFVKSAGELGLAFKQVGDAMASPEQVALQQQSTQNMRDMGAEWEKLTAKFGGVQAPSFSAAEAVSALNRELLDLTAMGANTLDFLNTLGEAFGAFGAGIALSAKGIAQVFTGDWMGATASVNAAAEEFAKIPGILDAEHQRALARLTAQAPEISQQARDNWRLVPTAAQEELATVPGVVDAELAVATAAVATNLAESAGAAATGATAVVTAIATTLPEVGAVTAREMPRVTAAVQAEQAPAAQAGSGLGDAIIAGIRGSLTGNWGGLAALVADRARSLLVTAKQALDIKSPSGEFMIIGYESAAGLAVGFQVGMPMVEAAVLELTNRAALTATMGFQQVRDAYNLVIPPLANDAIMTFQQVRDSYNLVIPPLVSQATMTFQQVRDAYNLVIPPLVSQATMSFDQVRAAYNLTVPPLKDMSGMTFDQVRKNYNLTIPPVATETVKAMTSVGNAARSTFAIVGTGGPTALFGVQKAATTSLPPVTKGLDDVGKEATSGVTEIGKFNAAMGEVGQSQSILAGVSSGWQSVAGSISEATQKVREFTQAASQLGSVRLSVGQSFGSGGIVQGHGTAGVGVTAHPGELILNLAQQRNLAGLLASPPAGPSGGGGRSVTVVLQNYGYLGSQSDFDALISNSVRSAMDGGTF